MIIFEIPSHFFHTKVFLSLYLFLTDGIMPPLIRDLVDYSIYEPTYTNLMLTKVFDAHFWTKL
jgi:hypothetical protein